MKKGLFFFYWKDRDHEFFRSVIAFLLASVVFFLLFRLVSFEPPPKPAFTQYPAVTSATIEELKALYPDFDFLYEDPFALEQKTQAKAVSQLEESIQQSLNSQISQATFQYEGAYFTLTERDVNWNEEGREEALEIVLPPLPDRPSSPLPFRQEAPPAAVYRLQFSPSLATHLPEDWRRQLRSPPLGENLLLQELLLTLSPAGEVIGVLGIAGQPVSAEIARWVQAFPFEWKGPGLLHGAVTFQLADSAQ